MRDGFVRVAAASPDIRVADAAGNTASILETAKAAEAKNVQILVLPELAVTGYTCGDLFLQRSLLDGVKDGLRRICRETADSGMLLVAGSPWLHGGKLYNAAVFIQNGEILGVVPKKNLPNYGEFYEARWFAPGEDDPVDSSWMGENVPFGCNLLFACRNLPELIIGAEICEDLWVPAPPSTTHALAGATLIVNCSASDEVAGKADYRRSLVSSQSAGLVSAYIYATAGEGESTTDLVFGGQNLIAENGSILAESPRFVNGMITAELDMERLAADRRRMSTYGAADERSHQVVEFQLADCGAPVERRIDPSPFVPKDEADWTRRCEEILMIQAMGLKKRLVHTGSACAVVGISGGLDSTLALLVTARAFDLAGLPRENILSVTMPGFGTTDRTYNNACTLTRRLGATLMEVSIRDAVNVHFRDIGQDPDKHDVTYENSQARERTQILMDLANQRGGMVIGTGDMSELALGWATYNGDHMSMYGVNAGVPKTLVRHLVRYFADSCKEEALSEILRDVLDTPVSPELLPPKDGVISQITEDLVGPYELHDFFLYYVLRFGFSPSKIFRLAQSAFSGTYENTVILQWEKTFYRRFFGQQFKRSCLPDGPKVGSVAVSPRGDLRMPSDASRALWMAELEQLEAEKKGQI